VQSVTRKDVELEGSPIRCLHEGLGGRILAIGHFSPEFEWPPVGSVGEK